MKNFKFNTFKNKQVHDNSELTNQIDPKKALEANYFSCSWPNLYYDRLDSIVKMIEPEIFVEIGVAYGYHAADVLTKNKNLKYVGVDPYVYNYDPNDGFCKDVENLFRKPGQLAMDLLFETVNQNLNQNFPDRTKLMRLTSVIACSNFEDKSIDFLFIDGDHRFMAVLEDCKNWYPKIKIGGVMVGDDWNWKSVSEAVEKFAMEQNLSIILLKDTKSDHTLWMITKF